jgi:membrane protein implicated in regulation of membrane protease activity
MVVLGLILLLAAGLGTAALVSQNTDAAAVTVAGHAFHGTLGGLFLAGVAAGVVGLLGVLMLLTGLSRRRARRAGLKRQVREAHSERETLAEENTRLQRELDAAQAAEPAYQQDAATGGRHVGNTETV